MIDTTAIKDKIILAALCGKLVPQDRNEGTAEQLISKIYPNKKLASDINKEDVLFSIPETWKWCRFSDIVDFFLGKTPARGSKAYWNNGVYPWISISDIPDDGRVTTTREKVSEKAAEDCFSNGISKSGTLIMSFKLTIGKVAILDIDAFHNEAIISIFPKYDEDCIFRDYLFWILPFVAKNTNSYGAIKGNTLNKKSLSNMIVPVPPLYEQRRIVNKLEEVFEYIEAIDTAQADYENNFEVLKNKIITAGIQGKLTGQIPEDESIHVIYQKLKEEKERLVKQKIISKEKPIPEVSNEEAPYPIPDNWKWVRFSDLYSLSNGVASRGSEGGKPHPVLRLADLTSGEIDTSSVRSIDLTDSEFNSHKIHKGDLVFIRVNGSRDKVANAFLYSDEEEISYCDHLFCGHKISDLFEPAYIMLVYHSSMVKKQIDPEIKTTAGQNTINQKSMSKIMIPLPPTAEQRRIVDKVNMLLSSMPE